MLKQILFAALICLLLTTTIFAQEKVEPSPISILVDEFGDLPPSDFIARLDNLIAGLQNTPGAKAFIIVYRTQAEPPGKNVRILEGCRIYLTRDRRLDSQLLALVDGGVAGVGLTQLWIVPPGTTPKPRADAYPKVIEDRRTARKYDEFFYSLNAGDYESSYGFYNQASIETFANAVKNEPDSIAYVIAYAQYEVDEYEDEDRRGKKIVRHRITRDAPGAAAKMLRYVRNRIVTNSSFAPTKIKTFNGGYRKMPAIELWILPGGVHSPVATPNAFPKVVKTRNKTGTK